MTANQSSRSARLFQDYRREDSGSYHTAPVDPGSPTDVDEDDYYTPPSPSSAAQQRAKASPFTSRSNPRKRPSDSSIVTESPPKLTKVYKGKQPADLGTDQDNFIKPALYMARSFQATATTTTNTSANTSFNNSLVSSQETQATSVNTSFMIDGANDDAEFRPRKSSTSLESLGGSDVFATLSKAERTAFDLQEQREKDRVFSQEASRESASTYDSIDESLWNEAETRVMTAVALGPELSASTPPKIASKASDLSNESPLRVPWYIRDIPSQDLFTEALPDHLANCPYFFAFICCRVACSKGISMDELVQSMDLVSAQNDCQAFWKAAPHTPLREPSSVWTDAKKSLTGYVFKGKLLFNNKRNSSSPVFKLELSPIQKDKSCRLERMFGSDRFLYLTVPSFHTDKPDRFTLDEMMQIEKHWKSWLLETHLFLGRRWRVFHIEPIEKKKGALRKDSTADKRLVLFATEGLHIEEPLLIGQMLNQFFDFEANKEQNFCKAFARFDLALSRTTPTYTFELGQIIRVNDTFSNGTPEDQMYNDTGLDWADCKTKQVMNDGCSQISVGAAQKVWEAYRSATGSDEPLPSAFQGRIAGAKGMWMLSAEPHTRDPHHLSIWIEITDSQLKFETRQDTLKPQPHSVTFDYLKHSFLTGATNLHISFIPILADRGVPSDIITTLIRKQLDDERKQLLEMLHDTVPLHNWTVKLTPALPTSGLLTWQASLPLSLAEKVKFLLRHGFHPEKNSYLAARLMRFIKSRQAIMEQKLRAPLGKATNLLGLADPLRVLKPGEVHVHFSKPFVDEFTMETFRHLDGLELLVARQPACRRSDIQKVRAISHPKLSHLVDVIVFPATGQYPLAGKLQGGDYDGDIFWTCWQSELVEPFRNAPAPYDALDPADFGIKKDTRRLYDVMNPGDLSTVDSFLEQAIRFRVSETFLGKATNLLDSVAYRDNKIHSESLNELCAVHDLLVDAPKQALCYERRDFEALLRKHGDPPKPAHKQAMEFNARRKAMSETDTDQQRTFRHKSENLLDYLYFDVIRAHNVETLKLVDSALSKEDDDDADLTSLYTQVRALDIKPINAELDALVVKFGPIATRWNDFFPGDKKPDFPGARRPEFNAEKHNSDVETCYALFRCLMPSSANASKPEIALLLCHFFGPEQPSLWEMIRASALYATYRTNKKRMNLVWNMAGRELCLLKVGASQGTYSMVPAIFANMKPKPMKAYKPADDDEDSEDELETSLEQVVR